MTTLIIGLLIELSDILFQAYLTFLMIGWTWKTQFWKKKRFHIAMQTFVGVIGLLYLCRFGEKSLLPVVLTIASTWMVVFHSHRTSNLWIASNKPRRKAIARRQTRTSQ